MNGTSSWRHGATYGWRVQRLGVVIVAALVMAVAAGPARADAVHQARCTFVVDLAFDEAIGTLGTPPQDVAFASSEPGAIVCTGSIGGQVLRESGTVEVEGLFSGTCLAHRASGSYRVTHASDGGSIVITGTFTNQRAVDKTALTIHGENHSGYGTATAAPNASPCRQPFDAAVLTAELTIVS